jgi:hypothetical protein
MRNSERYMAQAETVMRMAERASSPAEWSVYETIAEGWRKLASEARRNECQSREAPASSRSTEEIRAKPKH